MMKKFSRFAALLLAMTMCTAVALPVSAAELPNPDYGKWTLDSEGNRVDIVSGMVDTSPLEISMQPYSVDGTRYLFRMNLTAMYDDLHTPGAKSFTKASLQNDYVRADGVIENAQNTYVTVGLAEYDDAFRGATWTYRDVECGKFFSESWSKSDLSPHFYYYGYARSPYMGNDDPYSGYIDYYDSTFE